MDTLKSTGRAALNDRKTGRIGGEERQWGWRDLLSSDMTKASNNCVGVVDQTVG